jgi:large repetitive protein
MLAVTRRLSLAALGGLFSVLLLGPAPVSAVDNPTVSSVSPRQGSSDGGDTVTLNGSGFYCGTGGPVVQGSDNPYNGHDEPPPHDYLNVFFGGNAANIIDTPSDSLMHVQTPAGSGTVDVTVTCGAGTTVSSAPSSGDKYTYVSSIDGSSLGNPSSGSGADAGSSSSLPSQLAQTGGGPAARAQGAAGAPWALLALLLVVPAGWLARRRFGSR